MINFSYGFNYNRPHKHLLNKNESYLIIEGLMEIYLISEKNKIIKKIKIEKKKE